MGPTPPITENRTQAVAPAEDNTSNATFPHFRAALHKGSGTRLYLIDEAVPGWWHCEIIVDAGSRTRLIEGRHRAQIVAKHFQQQVDDLVRGGWVMEAGRPVPPDPESPPSPTGDTV